MTFLFSPPNFLLYQVLIVHNTVSDYMPVSDGIIFKIKKIKHGKIMIQRNHWVHYINECLSSRLFSAKFNFLLQRFHA